MPTSPPWSRVQGRVSLLLVIGDDGTVRAVDVTASPDPSLSGAAVESFRRFRYRPAMKDGRAVAVYADFTLSE